MVLTPVSRVLWTDSDWSCFCCLNDPAQFVFIFLSPPSRQVTHTNPEKHTNRNRNSLTDTHTHTHCRSHYGCNGNLSTAPAPPLGPAPAPVCCVFVSGVFRFCGVSFACYVAILLPPRRPLSAHSTRSTHSAPFPFSGVVASLFFVSLCWARFFFFLRHTLARNAILSRVVVYEFFDCVGGFACWMDGGLGAVAYAATAAFSLFPWKTFPKLRVFHSRLSLGFSFFPTFFAQFS